MRLLPKILMNINSLYINSEQCAAALEYKPNIVIIKFGANDANKKNFENMVKRLLKQTIRS